MANNFDDILRKIKNALQGLISSHAENADINLPQLPGASVAFTAKSLSELYPGRPILIVTEGLHESEAVYSDLCAIGTGDSEPYLLLPPEDKERHTADHGGMRLAAAAALHSSSEFGARSSELMAAPSSELGAQSSELPECEKISTSVSDGQKDNSELRTPNSELNNYSELRTPNSELDKYSGSAAVFVTTPTALLSPIPNPTALEEVGLQLSEETSSPIPFSAYAEYLAKIGYERKAEVTTKETFAIRGGLIDIWPPTSPLPLRIDFFGDEIETIREFDPMTQRSQEKKSSIWIPPTSGNDSLPLIEPVKLIPPGSIMLWINADETRYNTRRPTDDLPTEEAYDELIALISPIPNLLNIYSSSEFGARSSELSECETISTSVKDGQKDNSELRTPNSELNNNSEHRTPNSELNNSADKSARNESEPPNLNSQLSTLNSADNSELRTPNSELAVIPVGLPTGITADPSLRADARKQLFRDLENRAVSGETVILCIDTAGGIEWLSRELPIDTKITFRQTILSGGFSIPALGITVLAQPDIYSTRKLSGRRLIPSSIASKSERVNRAEELRPGDLVVHIDHGIGRYLGTTEVINGDQKQEVFTILYAEDVKLHVPVAHAHLLSRYIGVSGKGVALHKLGGKKWKTDCVKAEKSVIDYASQLLDLQAKRNAVPGYAFDPNPPWLESFEAAFPYKETKDQITCIDAVKRDMASTRPMDRLICGDAGYGKTEIAMRAAFLAVMNGKQVAILAPTTVLAEQHYTTFRERMAAYPVRIEVVNRLRTPAYRQKVLTDTAHGSIDILIGTHAIIQPGTRFKDLGLVIIDEEQRFGVEDKERLKRLKATVDVLTLSATPIPRTLYMSMTGARDMSLLQTPPQERLEIETKVVRDNDHTIREAVLREINRKGQIFFLHNRVLTIEIIYNRLKALLPEVRIAIAHGQMKSSELGETMRKFEAGEYDMLLSTSIVESGLDIPRANTIIIHRADRFGLAELYQLRGRVGRSSRRGYAYLLLPEHGIIERDAKERIKAIQRHGGLSGGLNLALRDLEIRGAGNMLGAEQSGHIAAVGFGLYCQLLKRTVARLKGEKPPVMVDVELSLDFIDIAPSHDDSAGNTASIPYTYIDDETLRMSIHRRIAEATEIKEIRELKEELNERFGALPSSVSRLLRIAELRITAANNNLSKIEVKNGVVRPFNRLGIAVPGSDGKFPRLKGKTADTQLTNLFRIINVRV